MTTTTTVTMPFTVLEVTTTLADLAAKIEDQERLIREARTEIDRIRADMDQTIEGLVPVQKDRAAYRHLFGLVPLPDTVPARAEPATNGARSVDGRKRTGHRMPDVEFLALYTSKGQRDAAEAAGMHPKAAYRRYRRLTDAVDASVAAH